MSGGIYLIQGDDLLEMTEQRFENEELFQTLLAKYPRVLGGDQMDGETPKRWLLVTREAGIPVDQDSSDRWAVDHLFVDEEAIPTFVEVKRKSDTRLRREVVGQMLDYVSHATISWTDGRLRQFFETQCSADGADELLVAVLGAAVEADRFWADVDANLRAGRVRLVFVADEFPPELSRIVEFLNGQMKPAEVIGIEVRQYVGGGLQTLVPRVIGQSAATKDSERGSRWDEGRFLNHMSTASPASSDVARQLMAFGLDISSRPVEWGTGKHVGSFTARLAVGKEIFSLFTVRSSGDVTVNIGWNSARLDRLGIPIYEEYRQRANDLFGVNITEAQWKGGYNAVPLSRLIPDKIEAFKALVRDLGADLQSGVPARTT